MYVDLQIFMLRLWLCLRSFASESGNIFERIKAIVYSRNCLKDYNCAVECVRTVLNYLFQQAPHSVYLSDPRRLKISLVWWSLIALLVVRPTKTQLKLCRYQSLNPDNLVYWSLIFTLCSWLDIANNSLHIYLQLMREIKD